MSLGRSWVNSVVLSRRECIACNHVLLSRKRSAGHIEAPVRVCTPILHFPRVFHGEVGGTKEVYGPGLVIESLSGSPSIVAM